MVEHLDTAQHVPGNRPFAPPPPPRPPAAEDHAARAVPCVPRFPQAKLAAPLVQLLQTHGQPVDPNLVALAEAWERVEAALSAAQEQGTLGAAALTPHNPGEGGRGILLIRCR